MYIGNSFFLSRVEKRYMNIYYCLDELLNKLSFFSPLFLCDCLGVGGNEIKIDDDGLPRELKRGHVDRNECFNYRWESNKGEGGGEEEEDKEHVSHA